MRTNAPDHDPAPRPAAGDGAVTVFAPASIGNLAAGFDVLGVALAPLDGEPWGDFVTAAPAAADELRCRGPFAARLPADPRENLVWRAREAVARRLGAPLPPLALTLHKGLPVASGLGSSAASAVAAVVAIDEALGRPLGDAGRLAAAAEAEASASGAIHLDNVAPILFGGVRLIAGDAGPRELPWPDDLRFVLLLPELALPTRQARAVLPPAVPLPLAVAHAQNLATLVHALHAGERPLLAASLRDLLVEPHRAPLVPGFAAVQAAAREAGALGCSLSGAGPALFAVAAAAHAAAVGERAAAAWRRARIACRIRLCRVDPHGARRVEG
ncbi:MAG TPA: homoserine kinase [Thermoanaerobaculia bacterium]|nr:homoserine kinase [Thermoanaerobaculia bacterium]